jgi:hypothetical protein
MGYLTDGVEFDDLTTGLDRGSRVFGPGERVMLTWRSETTLILREPGENAQQGENAEKWVSTPHTAFA